MTEAELERQIDQAEAKVGQLRGDLIAAQNKLEALRVALASQRFTIKIGDIVALKDKEYRVCRIQPWGKSRPWLHGHPRLKGGGFGNAERRIYDGWSLVSSD